MKIKLVLLALGAAVSFLFTSCFGMGLLGYNYGYESGYDYEYDRQPGSTEDEKTTSTTTRRDRTRTQTQTNTGTTTTRTRRPTQTTTTTTTTQEPAKTEQTQAQTATTTYSDKKVAVFYSSNFGSDTTLTFYPASNGKKRFVYQTVYNGKSTIMEGTYDSYPLPETNLNIFLDNGDGYNALCTETGKILYVPGLGSFERTE